MDYKDTLLLPKTTFPMIKDIKNGLVKMFMKE